MITNKSRKFDDAFNSITNTTSEKFIKVLKKTISKKDLTTTLIFKFRYNCTTDYIESVWY